MARRRIPQLGDLFLVPQSNGKYTLGQILAFWPDIKSVATVGCFSEEVLGDWEMPAYIDVAGNCSTRLSLIAVLSTPIRAIARGEWKYAGGATVTLPPEILPSAPYRTGSDVGATFESAPLVEGLIAAYRGLTGWDSLLPGRPGYLKSLLFRQPMVH